MSFQWTVIAFVLYSEVGLTILLLLPFITSRRWKSIVQSRLGQSIGAYANYYFNIFMLLLGLCFLDSIREIRKYHGVDRASAAKNSQVGTIEHMNMKLFRAQRNFYIAGFALFLWFVLRRLVTLQLTEADVEENAATNDSAHREEREALETRVRELTERIDRANEQAMGAEGSDEAGRLATLQAAYDELKAQLDQNRQGESSGEGSDARQGQQLTEQLNETKELLRTSEQELDAVKMESEGVKEELDRLAADYHELQAKYNTLVEAGDDKKSN